MPKINDLPQVETLSQSAYVPITQDGVTYKASVDDFAKQNALIVNIVNEDGQYKCDKDYNDILTAVRSNNKVLAHLIIENYDYLIPFSVYDKNQNNIVFSAIKLGDLEQVFAEVLSIFVYENGNAYVLTKIIN